ncbi:MAG: hypothetical protein GY807_21805 [Gammaproteobacteria bacterium]|nr:hypothetical protein [Gammaproteobacteria bacterium]
MTSARTALDTNYKMLRPLTITRSVLARENPGISVFELTDLFPVDREVALNHAHAVLSGSGVSIDLGI